MDNPVRFQADLVQNSIFFEHEHSSENNGESVIIPSRHLRVKDALMKCECESCLHPALVVNSVLKCANNMMAQILRNSMSNGFLHIFFNSNSV